MPRTLSSPPLSPTSDRPGIRWVAVQGGFLDGLDMRFAPGANVICGGPGSGKSTALTLVRYVLMLPVPTQRRAEIDGAIATNLGTGRAYVALVSAHGTEYVLSRAGGEKEPRVESPKGISWKEVLELLPIRFVGQNELPILATDGLERLALIRGFAGDDLRRVESDLARVRRELDAGGEPLFRMRREIEALAKRFAGLPTARARLEELKSAAGGDPLDLEAAHRLKVLRDRERLMFERARTEMDALGGELGVFVASARRRLGQSIDAEAMRDGPNATLVSEVGAAIARVGGAIEEMATRVAEEQARARDLLTKSGAALVERHAPDDDAYRALLAKHESNAGRAFERLQLEATVAELARAEAEHAARKQELAQVVAARDALLARHRALVEERRAVLERTGKRLTGETKERVLVEVAPEAERGAWRALLGELTKGKHFEKDDVDAVARAIGPDDLCAQVLRGNASVLTEVLGSSTKAGRLLAVLGEHPRLYALQTVDLPDVPTIKLLDGKAHKPSETLSGGQRTVAFVSLLLLDRRGTLVIDQPEDNVANPYLARFLSGVIAELQAEMQLVFVTHNGNLPILGRVQRVFEMDADGARGWIARQGEPRELQAPMEDHFEGGRRAFVERKDFYGIE